MTVDVAVWRCISARQVRPEQFTLEPAQGSRMGPDARQTFLAAYRDSSSAVTTGWARGDRAATERRDGDTWVLNGVKKWIGNATWCNLIVVWGRDEAYARPGARPRPRGLRHTFATQTMIDAYLAGRDPARTLTLLSVWLGHANPADTYWYLQRL